MPAHVDKENKLGKSIFTKKKSYLDKVAHLVNKNLPVLIQPLGIIQLVEPPF